MALNVGSIFIGDDEIISFGAQYKDIIFAMSDCDDEIVIAKTYPDASSVEVLGYDGNDNILLGDESRPLDTIIFANIIIDGGRGNMDILKIRDQGSVISKPVAVRPTTLKGMFSNLRIVYFYVYYHTSSRRCLLMFMDRNSRKRE